ncbi:hypothetical protein, partial [Mycobacteroides abscessus]|uniref:hypothetical protein n=1 Tax=Mycobacteroides abscessus TaxID=36809 RepID=UPI001A7E11E7
MSTLVHSGHVPSVEALNPAINLYPLRGSVRFIASRRGIWQSIAESRGIIEGRTPMAELDATDERIVTCLL